MRINRIVINASPLISLFRSDLQDLLPALFSEILVPDAVWQEVTQSSHDDVAASGLTKAQWATHLAAATVDPVVQAWDLGAGESSVLTYAREHSGYRVAIDDAAARRCARSLSLMTLGTGGIILLAKHRGLIPSVNNALQSLKHSGLWLGDSLVNTLLEQAGEK